MPLERGMGRVVEAVTGDLLFPMLDGSRLVPCRVTSEALYFLTGGGQGTLTRAFESARLHIEVLASAKYDYGLVGEDGVVVVEPTDFRLRAH